MPLHLLGKKSWNVYNHDNIERVKRDEAEAAAKEAAKEQRMQEVDAERRIRLLQGLPVKSYDDEPPEEPETQSSAGTYSEVHRRRRRLPGEDDTDRDIRYAREAQLLGHEDKSVRSQKYPRDAPLHDTTGHINLFQENENQSKKRKTVGNPEAELEKARKERALEDQYTMRFSNAGGFKQAVDKKPWYHGESAANDHEDSPKVDKDPKRKQREELRLASDDPLAAIQKGVKGVRQADRDRKEWKERRRRDIDDMIKEEKRASRRRVSDDDLENFSLDAADPVPDKHRHHHVHRHRHRHRHRSEKDRSRSPRRRDKRRHE